MHRRSFLGALAAATTGAGCVGTAGETTPTRPEDPPSGVYRPTQAAGASLVGTATVGDYALGLLVGPPRRFWEVTGRRTYPQTVATDDDVHVYALAWDPDTGLVLPDVGLTVAVAGAGTERRRQAVYAMLGQRLGYHYGDNLALPGEGPWDVTVRVSGLTLRRTGAFAGRFDDAASHTFRLPTAAVPSATGGTSPATGDGPLAPATNRGVPLARVPAPDALPGTRLGRATLDDCLFEMRRLDHSDQSADGGASLSVHALTPRNRYLLPSMGLRLHVTRSGRTRADPLTTRTLDPALGYHYGAVVPSVSPGDRVTVEVLTPPQLARHEGYETAFLEGERASVRV